MCVCVYAHICVCSSQGLDMLELKSQELKRAWICWSWSHRCFWASHCTYQFPVPWQSSKHLSQRAGSPAPKFMLLWSQIYLPRFIYLFYNKDFLMPRSEGKKVFVKKRKKKKRGWGRGSPGALAQRLGAPAAFPVQFSWQLTAGCSSSSRGPDTFILAKHRCVWNKNK